MKPLNLLISLICCLSFGPIHAQLSVVADHPQASYALNESMNFVVTSDQSGPIEYEIVYDRFTSEITTGTIVHVADQNSMIPYSQTEPGAVLCRITGWCYLCSLRINGDW